MKAFYNKNIQATKEELQVLEKNINRNSLMRLALILIGAAILFQTFQMNNIWVLFAAVFTIVLGFAYLVLRQSKLEKLRDVKKAFLRVNENELHVDEHSENMYANGAEFEDGKHAYSSDLDIFGEKSLFLLINRSATVEGTSLLASWLSIPASKSEILARQEASAELSSKREWTQLLQTKLLFNLGQKVNIKTFMTRYMKDESLNFGSSFMRLYVKVAPFLFLAGIFVSLFVTPIWNYLLLLAIVHLIWSMALGGKVSYFSSRIDKIGVTLIAYSDAIRMVEGEKFTTSLNQKLQSELRTGKQENLSLAFRGLGSLVDKLDARNNILVGAVLNMFLLWDFKQVLAIVDWKKNYEGDVLKAFDIISEFEALISLATLKSNFETWATPVILDNPQSDRISALEINHPLINNKIAVANDYSAHDHQLALITGSNMAGKSTFLRTIGINAVLAYAGAVVCAKELALPVYWLVSYMRIKDNLNESTSTFKAELDRMKFILEQLEKDGNTYVLIDEMLRGTNSVDKYLGSKAIIRKILAINGKGMVATHDLQLASLEEEYEGLLKNFHFDIQVKDGEMLFDYKLKNGKCTVFNASLLLKGIGVHVQND
ncbi:MutS-related protein [Sphingobacterium bovistauri]|uniref:DNA mismatch repair protein MutS n=1 Tax=Sphingobacterium bovistauri TaxID=2781959 RepID=A0ABS7Z5X6_9SPHI|nr:DNA mismatch repair protein MutS [Sphingobacterium bovistauri]MCA5004982.1 DNA mismatch repair protein MutS [Sphingobacterium bovistauri]